MTADGVPSLVAVGKIGPAHGVRGDVFVEPWTDEPEDRFARRRGAAHRPESTPVRSTVDGRRVHGGQLRRALSTASTTATRPRRCAACVLLRRRADASRRSTTRRVLRHRAGRPARRRTVDGAALGAGHARSCIAGVGLPGRRGRRRPGACWSRSSPAIVPEVDIAGGHGRDRPAGRAVRPVSGPATRRRHDLPRVPGAAAAVAARQGDRARPGRRCACTTCGDWTDDVHRTVDDTPYGGGPGHGDAARAVGPRAGRDRARRTATGSRGWSCRRRPAGRSPRRWPPSSRPSPGWCSRAAGTRASTRGSSSTPAGACRSTRSASATTCWPAARWRCW